MILKEIWAQCAGATKPILQVIKKGDHFKNIAIAMPTNAVLKEHKTAIPSKLVVVEGSVIYRDPDQVIQLDKFDELDIPLDIMHSLECTAQSICILMQG